MKTENWIRQDNGALLSPDGSKMLVVDTESSVNEKSGMPYTSKATYKLIHLDQNSQDEKGLKPREFWVNKYEKGAIGIYENVNDASIALLHSRKYAPSNKGETIKVREVLD